MSYRLVFASTLLVVGGCTRSPLADPHIVLRGATRGDVPRDVNGEPILDRVKPVLAGALPPPSKR
nr:hypothetical protein [Polymorphobacter sp.]